MFPKASQINLPLSWAFFPVSCWVQNTKGERKGTKQKKVLVITFPPARVIILSIQKARSHFSFRLTSNKVSLLFRVCFFFRCIPLGIPRARVLPGVVRDSPGHLMRAMTCEMMKQTPSLPVFVHLLQEVSLGGIASFFLGGGRCKDQKMSERRREIYLPILHLSAANLLFHSTPRLSHPLSTCLTTSAFPADDSLCSFH